MQIIMGGSGSTGSSLLKNILNRNEEIFSGGETAFFAKKMIYENWTKARKRILKRKFSGLRNHGWHIYNGTDLLQSEYLWKEKALEALLQNTNTLKDFTARFYAKALQKTGARIWLEKTPANAACFTFFLNSYEDGKVIHMVRNPFDTIASLMSRGYDLYYATGIYLLNTACGLTIETSPRSITVKYEDLIASPEAKTRELCTFLDITYAPHMLEPQGENISQSKLEGWNYDETQAIGKAAVGRFDRLDDEEQNAIMEAVNLIQISNTGKAYYNTDLSTVGDICQRLGYDFYPLGKRSMYGALRRLRRFDRFRRITRGYPTGFYYPLEISK